MRHITSVAFLVALSAATVKADILARFDFNTPDNNASTGTFVSTTGMGTLAPVGGATTFFGFGTGSSDPALGANNSALGVGGFPTQGAGTGTVGLEGALSTAGYGDIRLTFDQKNQPSSNKFYDVQIRTAPAGPFQSIETYGIAAADMWENAKMFDLSAAVPAAANNADFAFRIVAVFQPGTMTYVASEAGYNGDIPTLFDMITIEGTIVPEPPTTVLMILGIVALTRRHRN